MRKKSEEEMRTVSVKVRMTTAEHALLQSKRGKMRLAAWMRETCKSEMPREIPAINIQVLKELNYIGININQLAKELNATGKVRSSDIVGDIRTLRQVLLGATE